ncbi:MAG: PIG-L family deacetylase [Bacillota bacterium]
MTQLPLAPVPPPHPRRHRALAIAGLVLAAWMAVRLGLTAWPADVLAREKPQLQVGWGERLLVVAPHPDDETLAAAGLIQRVLSREGRVRVVVLTNGDGYSLAAREYFRRPTLSRKDLLRFGSIRMTEARQAAARLGMDPREVVFLGFPDRGLVRLLLLGSTQSRFTGANSVPYQECLRPGAQYTRQQLEQQLRTVIADFRPTLILFPSAQDGHPDHRAAHYLTRDVLAGVYSEETSGPPPRLLTYLVHPRARSRVLEQYLGLPAAVEKPAEAECLALAPAERAAKRYALAAYVTQRAIWSDLFLASFLGPAETFTPTSP